MSCRYGKYPFCKQCLNTKETCKDKYIADAEDYEDRKELRKQIKEMLED